jgi:hypothetical protein
VNPDLALLAEVAGEIETLVTEADFTTAKDRNGGPPDLSSIALKFLTNTRPHLRLSHGADCSLQKWFSHMDPDEARGKDFGSRITFAMGDLWEALFLHILKEELADHPWIEWVEGSEQMEVVVNGIRGHIDGLIKARGTYILLDPKCSTSFAMKHYEQGRVPDRKWGYRHQAGNYLTGLRGMDPPIEAVGMIWPVWARDKGYMHLGFASYDEVVDYCALAIEDYDRALMGMDPPEPCNPCRTKSPCRASKNGKIYCDFYEHCCRVFPTEEN